MGTWGEGPFDNDAAGDLVAGMMKSINKVVEKDDRYSYEAARACAQFVLAAHGTDILGGPGLAPLIRALARIRMNREWVGGFRRPRKIASALNRELEAVLERTRTCKGCKKSIDKSERHALESLVATARSQPVPKSARPKRRVARTTRATVSKLIRTKAPASRR